MHVKTITAISLLENENSNNLSIGENMNKTLIASALLLACGAANAAPVSTGGVFNMCSQEGLDTTGVCTTPINVDATITGFVDEAAGTWGVESTTLFFGLNWTAHDGFLIAAPGSYSLDVNTGVLGAGTGVVAADGIMNFDVGAGQIAGIIDFDYGTTVNIKVIDVWDINADGSLTGVGIPGMENGPFPGFNAQFNLTAAGLVPVPAAVWLFGSGLLGLVGVARRKKAA